MKKRYYLFGLLAITSLILLQSYSGNEIKNTGGSPAGYTGSPGDGRDCADCHGGSSSTVSNWITSDIPAEGYTPGTTYNITVTVSGSGKKGYEVSPQNTSGDLLGTLIAGTGSKLVGSGKYVTQSNASNSNPKVWNFQWTAPVAGTGEVTFYGAFTVTEPVTKLSTLTVPEKSTIGIPENHPGNMVIYPNPSANNVNVSYFLLNNENVKISVYSLDGKLISVPVNEMQTEGQHNLQVNNLQSGIYLVVLQTSSKKSIEKIVIE